MNLTREVRSPAPKPPNLLLKESFQFAHGELTAGLFTAPRQAKRPEVSDMTRRLVFIPLAAVLGLAVAGVASAKRINVIRGKKSADAVNCNENRDFNLRFAGHAPTRA